MGKNKRTPTGKIDDARKEADAEWEVEAIIACSTGKEGVKYLVRWKGFDEKHDTYEFEKNLQDAQDALKEFQIDTNHLIGDPAYGFCHAWPTSNCCCQND